eukprot:m.162147 g.162147  ORF g.162147 m.162147 type:complete len:355 (+) comp31264_c0_seq6:521-1585(+)
MFLSGLVLVLASTKATLPSIDNGSTVGGITSPPPPPLYDVQGVFAVGTMENSLFLWHDEMYILENIGCGFLDHYGQWNRKFKGHSYARIRKLVDGSIIMNISETISHAFISSYPDYDNDRLWLFGINDDRCNRSSHGHLIQSFWSTDLLRWDSATAIHNVTTYNVEAARVDKPPEGMPPHKYVMILEPFQFMINNNDDGNLTYGWTDVDHEAPPAPSGGPSMRFSEGFYYIFTGGHNVFVLRSTNLKNWTKSTRGPLIYPTAADAQIAPYAGFPQDYIRQKFEPMHQNWTLWDWNSNDGDVCCMSPNATESWLVWGASTQGAPPHPPATECCTNAIGHSSMPLPELLKAYFEPI